MKPESDSENDFNDSEEEDQVIQTNKRAAYNAFEEDQDEPSDLEEPSDQEHPHNAKGSAGSDNAQIEAMQSLHEKPKSLKNKKLNKLSPEQLAKHQKKLKKTGVVYLSSIPPYMKPSKLRQVLSRFGEIDRLFLKPEDHQVYRRRVKFGGNKKRSFVEGWAEFVDKNEAKLCAHTLNGNKFEGKKGSFYYDDIMNIKYLNGYKWSHLTEQMSKEHEVRQAKLAAELSQAQKFNKSFIRNIEQSKMVTNMQKKKKQRGETGEDDVKRMFTQRDVTSRRADAPEAHKKGESGEQLGRVLSKVF